MNASSFANANTPAEPGLLAQWLAQVRLGTPQVHRDITVWPLFLPGAGGPHYRTLDEAVSEHQAEVAEVSASGSVPHLKVVNLSSVPLLILDGEELVGAKQNRVVNTTLLIGARSETIIPVSCTEQGRWRHTSPTFKSSDVVMEMKIRRAKLRSVSESLKGGEGHASDQGKIWDEIRMLQEKAAYKSATSAMNDLFKARERETKEALDAFPAQPGQQGLLVGIRQQVVGLDLLSQPEAYGRLHAKLLRSYVLDALLEKAGQPSTDEPRARQFLEEVATTREERFPAVGLGESARLQGVRTAGAALIHDRTVIHLAAFRADPEEEVKSEHARLQRLAQRRLKYRQGPVD